MTMNYPGTEPRPVTRRVATARPFCFVHINKCAGSSVEIALGLQKSHATAKEIRDHIGAREWDRRFTFTIVRHPAARVVSIYHYRAAQNALGSQTPTLDQWIERTWSAASRGTDPDLRMLAPASDWLCSGETMLVEYVARLEEMDRHWPEICAELGVAVPLGRYNVNRYPDWRNAIGPVAKKTIQRAFSEDFERFGYTF